MGLLVAFGKNQQTLKMLIHVQFNLPSRNIICGRFIKLCSFGVIRVRICLDHGASKEPGEPTLVMDSPVPLMHHVPERSWITDPDPDHHKGMQTKFFLSEGLNMYYCYS